LLSHYPGQNERLVGFYNRRNLIERYLHIEEHLIPQTTHPVRVDEVAGQSSGEFSTQPSRIGNSQPSNFYCKAARVAEGRRANAFLTDEKREAYEAFVHVC
jgi:hypothetical protein